MQAWVRLSLVCKDWQAFVQGVPPFLPASGGRHVCRVLQLSSAWHVVPCIFIACCHALQRSQ